MKDNVYRFLSGLFALMLSLSLQAQTCPTQIVDLNDDGAIYEATLSALSDCDAGNPFSYTTDISLGGQPYIVTSCYDNAVVAYARIESNGGSYIRLAETSGIIITSGSTSCAYNNAGQLVALPVELVSFSGKNTEGGNLLTWATANEVNNKGFDIQRLNGSTWESIGFVAAKGKSATYQFTDNLTSVRFETSTTFLNYYRLRQIDNDGTETFSKVISIQSKGAKGKLAVYPSPVSNLLTVEVIARNEATEGSDFQILNLLGQQVLTGKTLSVSKDSFGGGRGLDVSALPQGTYILKMGAEQAKFIKQ
ncbi:MAG: T9SS type A sorting domain-containing protein [Saprospiraceae bacterium]|nr:T9SS type A sorting domain-containing protein [Saprospiraceae bacterium]